MHKDTFVFFLLKDHLLSNFTDAVASIKKQTDQTYVNKLIVTNGLKVKKRHTYTYQWENQTNVAKFVL